jgi:hypothetical protein
MRDAQSAIDTLSNLVSFVKESLESISEKEEQELYQVMKEEDASDELAEAFDNYNNAISSLEDALGYIYNGLSDFYERHPHEIEFDEQYLYTNYRDYVTVRVLSGSFGDPVVRRFGNDKEAWQRDYDAASCEYKFINGGVGVIVSNEFRNTLKDGAGQ